MAMESSVQPLLSPRGGGGGGLENFTHMNTSNGLLLSSTNNVGGGASFSSSFLADEADIGPIKTIPVFFREFFVESRKLWYLAGPALFTSISQYSLGAITQTFAGHVGTIELAAVSVENSVIAGFTFGIMLGMGSALETLCGQAYGAGQPDMLGIYMQRSWVILIVTSLFCSLYYIFAEQFLRLIGQTEAISKAAGTFAVWMLPQLFAYAVNFPIAKFLQAQSKVMAMAWISAVTLVLHTFFSWLLMLKLRWGLVGAAVVLNASWWFIVVAQLVYIFSGTCGRAWTGFSSAAFHNLWGFLKLSLASAVMLCLEVWYYTALILFAGYLKNAEVSVDGLSICMNLLGWTVMAALGFNAAVSVRVSNELGAAHPRTARFSVVGAVTNSFLVGLVLSTILIIFRDRYPLLFTNSEDVIKLVYDLTPLLVFTIIIDNVQPVLSGVAVGAGWQAFVAYVNVGCYYVFGIPLGLILGYKLGFGVKGIWYGMISGVMVQTLILFGMVYKTNWKKEASKAVDRINTWGAPQDVKEHDESTTWRDRDS
ncbi:Protein DETOXIFICATION 29 [Dionaea muscipula]